MSERTERVEYWVQQRKSMDTMVWSDWEDASHDTVEEQVNFHNSFTPYERYRGIKRTIVEEVL